MDFDYKTKPNRRCEKCSSGLAWVVHNVESGRYPHLFTVCPNCEWEQGKRLKAEIELLKAELLEKRKHSYVGQDAAEEVLKGNEGKG